MRNTDGCVHRTLTPLISSLTMWKTTEKVFNQAEKANLSKNFAQINQKSWRFETCRKLTTQLWSDSVFVGPNERGPQLKANCNQHGGRAHITSPLVLKLIKLAVSHNVINILQQNFQLGIINYSVFVLVGCFGPGSRVFFPPFDVWRWRPSNAGVKTFREFRSHWGLNDAPPSIRWFPSAGRNSRIIIPLSSTAFAIIRRINVDIN